MKEKDKNPELPVHTLSAEVEYTGRTSRRYYIYEIAAGSAALATVYLRREIIGDKPPKTVWIQLKYQSDEAPDPLEVYQINLDRRKQAESDSILAERAAARAADRAGPQAAGEIKTDEAGDGESQ